MLLQAFNRLLTLPFSLALALVFPVYGSDDLPGQVDGSPDASDQSGFKPHELSFSLPTDGLARAEFRSEAFYAVILKSASRCAFKERDRLEIQQLFLKNKVFMDRFGCDDDVEENITYSNVNPDFSFIAVYAGIDNATANAFFDEQSLGKKFPGANIRKMQAILVFP
ncbi:MAG: hypothetical protein AAFW66_06185 [Pseudomonadota bacterium]